LTLFDAEFPRQKADQRHIGLAVDGGRRDADLDPVTVAADDRSLARPRLHP